MARRARARVSLGDRRSLADIGQTIAENFELRIVAGESYLKEIVKGADERVER